MLIQIFNYAAYVIALLGAIVIVWGTLLAFLKFLQIEFKKLRGNYVFMQREILRRRFGSYILLGLELFIASDLIHTILKPLLKDIAVLGSIVVIRTIVSYFLTKEGELVHEHELEELQKKENI